MLPVTSNLTMATPSATRRIALNGANLYSPLGSIKAGLTIHTNTALYGGYPPTSLAQIGQRLVEEGAGKQTSSGGTSGTSGGPTGCTTACSSNCVSTWGQQNNGSLGTAAAEGSISSSPAQLQVPRVVAWRQGLTTVTHSTLTATCGAGADQTASAMVPQILRVSRHRQRIAGLSNVVSCPAPGKTSWLSKKSGSVWTWGIYPNSVNGSAFSPVPIELTWMDDARGRLRRPTRNVFVVKQDGTVFSPLATTPTAGAWMGRQWGG